MCPDFMDTLYIFLSTMLYVLNYGIIAATFKMLKEDRSDIYQALHYIIKLYIYIYIYIDVYSHPSWTKGKYF